MTDETWKAYRRKLLLFLLTLAAACLVILFFFRTDSFTKPVRVFANIMEPFIIGIAIAFVLRPLALAIERGLKKLECRVGKKDHPRVNRIISVLCSVFILIAAIVLLLVAILPEVVNSLTRIAAELPAAYKRLVDWTNSLEVSSDNPQIAEIIGAVQESLQTVSTKLTDFLNGSLVPNLEGIVSTVTSSFAGIMGILKNFGLGCIVACYVMGSWEQLIAQCKLIVYGVFPRKAADWIRDETHFASRVFGGFISGKILDSIIIGLICFVFCSIVNMPYTVLISVVIGVTNIIPFFGPYLGAIPSIILLLTVNPGKCVLFTIFVILLQQFDGNLLGPAILGDKVGLRSIWILFSIMLFGGMWGLVGMIVGVPIFAIIYDLVMRFVVSGLKRKHEEALITAYEAKYPGPQKKEPKEKKKRNRKGKA